MAKSVTYVSDIPGDEGANVETLSFRIPAANADGRPMQVTLDCSEDIRKQFNEATAAAHMAYAKDLAKRLQFITKHAKVTEVKQSEPKAEGRYNGDRKVNVAIRKWYNAQEGVTPLPNQGRISDDVKAGFWAAVEAGSVEDPRKGAEPQDESGE